MQTQTNPWQKRIFRLSLTLCVISFLSATFTIYAYWREGPAYVFRNALEARRPLPDFYWTGETDMACLKAAIGQTLDLAYAHHIQRLMVTGNFALLAGVDPHVLHEWYLGAYADAFEWVEAPNTIGMSQYADGGLLGGDQFFEDTHPVDMGQIVQRYGLQFGNGLTQLR